MEKRFFPQFIIAAPSSGSGKTTVSRGLMALLAKQGQRVQPFKCGPDYIDTKFHTEVCGQPSINLDSFMSSPNHLQALYARYSADADVCIVEGMMGMFDGYNRAQGSSAEIAEQLHLPVVLVIDAKAVAYSVAPLLWGFIHFRPEIPIAGVIFNRVGSASHYAILEQACEELGVASLGYLPKEESLKQESRYLGLDFSRSTGEDVLDKLIALMEKYINLPLLLEKTLLSAPQCPECIASNGISNGKPNGISNGISNSISNGKPLHIVVARNRESFSFIYEEHLQILRRLGKVTFINPEEDTMLPTQVDLLYLPGGYPEKHLEALTQNQGMLTDIRNYAESGGRILAECGGMIYLSQGVADVDNQYPLAKVFPFTISMKPEDRRMSLGYRQMEWGGQTLRGHEFHYTQLDSHTCCSEYPSVVQVYSARGIPVSTPMYRYKNVIASYTHLYWGEIDILTLFKS